MDTKACSGPCGLEKPLTEFYDSRQGDAVYKFAMCKLCCHDRTQELRTRPENKARWAKYAHNTNIRRKYGIEPQQYDALLALQNGVCAICKQPEPTLRRLPVDHDHETKMVRGLLCTNCNNGLGRFMDSPDLLRAAAVYLEAHQTTSSF